MTYYRFHTQWCFFGDVGEIQEILEDATDLPRWWPGLCIEAARLQTGDAHRIGEVVRQTNKGFLPYTLNLNFTRVNNLPLTLEVEGDLVGRGIWSFQQHNATAIVDFDWEVEAEKPILKKWTFILRPIFAANHRWAMETGRRSIDLELQRRHATTERDRMAVPDPPITHFWTLAPWLLTDLYHHAFPGK